MAVNYTSLGTNDTIIYWQPSPNTRGTWNIIWSCVQTLVLCAWVSVCTNVPSPQQGRKDILIDKFFFLLLTLLGPELVVVLAFGQYVSARSSTDLFHAAGYLDWTNAHGFFADMGGIHVQPPKWKSFPVDAKQLHYLVTKKYIDYPRITKKEIQEMGKVDTATRLITLVQATMFFLTTIARLGQHLAVTTLELTVVANIFCTLITYACWWDKPTEVSVPRYYKLKTTIEEIVTNAELRSNGEYRDTPLDFASRKEWIASLLWNYYVNILRRLRLLGMFKRHIDRPLQRIPTFKWIQPESIYGNILLTIIGMAYFSMFLGAWNFYFPSSAEQQIWRVVVLVQCSIALVAALFSILEHILSFAAASNTEQHAHPNGPSSTAVSDHKTDLEKFKAFWNMPCNNELTGDFHCLDVPLRQLVVMTPICALYVVCRWFILAEDIAGLRALPASAFIQVDWSPYLPWF